MCIVIEAGLLTSYLVPAHFKECYKAVMFCVLLLQEDLS